MLCLYVQAPFAVFRTFTAGRFRPSSPFITPSGAYGLLLNLAGVEMRVDDGESPMTRIRQGLPPAEIALGALAFPHQHTLYQQLHNYPVGASGKDRAAATYGNKYNITPVRRALLSDIRAYVCVRGNAELIDWIGHGLAGQRPRKYGLPFLGDNNFLLDRVEVVDTPQPAHWYIPLAPDSENELSERIARLTLTIDRQDMSLTKSPLFRPTIEPVADIPDEAWIQVRY